MTTTFQERIFSAVGYIGILFLVPLLLMKDSQYAQFHGKQSLALFIAWVINALINVIPVLGWIVSFFGSLLLCVLMVLGVIKAYTGEKWKMPYVHRLVEKLNL
jgi:uncharacterized membrane protein